MIARPFTISRTFHAPRQRVWEAWTTLEALRQWFGPTGCTLQADALDLRPSGRFHYALQTPHGLMWGLWVFREVQAPERLVLEASFSDATGGITRHPGSATWPRRTLSTTTFTEVGQDTLLTLRAEVLDGDESEHRTFDGAHDSMTGGWSGTFAQLENFLAKAG